MEITKNFIAGVLIITAFSASIAYLCYLLHLTIKNNYNLQSHLASAQESMAKIEKGYKETLDELGAVKLANEDLRNTRDKQSKHIHTLANRIEKTDEDMVQLMKERMDALDSIELLKSEIERNQSTISSLYLDFKGAVETIEMLNGSIEHLEAVN